MKFSFLKTENTNKAIVSSVFFSFFAKLLTFAQSLVISYFFGTQIATDIIFYVISFILLFTTITYALDQQVIIPNAIYIRDNISESESKTFIMYIYIIYFIIGFVGMIMLFML